MGTARDGPGTRVDAGQANTSFGVACCVNEAIMPSSWHAWSSAVRRQLYKIVGARDNGPHCEVGDKEQPIGFFIHVMGIRIVD